MLEEVIIPRLDQGMEEGIVTSWLVEPGATVNAGDPLVEIETDKVNTELEAPVGGTVLRIDVPEGTQVPVGTVLAWVGDGSQQPPDTTPPPPQPSPSDEAPAQLNEDRVLKVPVDRTGLVRPHAESPRARFEATSAASATDSGTLVQLDSVRRAVAATVTRSWAIPQFDMYVDAEFGPTQELIDRWRTGSDRLQVTVTDLLLAAMARAVEIEPTVNAWFEDAAIRMFHQVNVTMLTQTDRGLVMPQIRDVAGRRVRALSAERARVVQAARANRLTRHDLGTGTIALSNLGAFGIHRFNALLVPPQVAVLAVGRAREVAGSSALGLTLTVDHRAVDGAAAARYLEAVAARIADPTLLLT